MAVQDDGKVVAVGTAGGKVFVARLIGGGTLQQRQGGFPDTLVRRRIRHAARFWTPTALSESAAGVAADADTIYVGGDARLSDGRQGFVLYRLRKADGSLVSRTFTEVTAPEGGTPRATDLMRLADGRLVVAGGLENGTRGVSQGALVSYQKSGTVDSAFGQNGLVLDKALTTEFRYTTAFGRIFGLTRTADGYALTAYKNAAGEVDFSWGGTGLVTGRYPSRVGKATTIAITTVSGQAKLLVGGFDGSGTGSRFFAARFQLGCVNIRRAPSACRRRATQRRSRKRTPRRSSTASWWNASCATSGSPAAACRSRAGWAACPSARSARAGSQSRGTTRSTASAYRPAPTGSPCVRSAAKRWSSSRGPSS